MSNQIVAAVDSVQGEAFARSPDGAVRPLEAGVPLYDGEILVADSGSEVVVAPNDGSSSYHVDGPIQLAMAMDIPADDAEIDPETLAEIIERFRQGDDLEPPAMGGGGGSRPHNLVMLERIVEPTEPAVDDFGTTPLRGEGPFQGIPLSISSGGGGGDPTPTPTPTPDPDPLTPDSFDVVEGQFTASVGNVLANDGLAPGATVAKVIVDGVTYDVPAGGIKIPTSLGGTLLIMQDGSFAYDAPARDHGGRGFDSDGEDIDRFQYIVKDADGKESGPTMVEINILDTVPVAHDDAYTLGSEHDAMRFGSKVEDKANVLDNDEFSKDYIRVDGENSILNIVHQVRSGDGATEIAVDGGYDINTPTFITANGGKVWIKPDGSFEYVPALDFKGDDTFQYQLIDGDGSKSNWATVTLTVPGPPDPVKPPVVDDAYDVVEATFTASVGNVLANDGLGSGATVAKVIVDGVTYDVPAGGIKIPTSLGGTLLIMQDGSFAYDAPARDHGGRGFDSDGEDIDRFQYIAKDANGNLSDPASVVINITDTVPVAHDDAYQLGSEHDSFRFTANVMDNDELSADYVLVAGKDSIQNVVHLVRTEDGAPEVAVDGSYDIYNPTFVTANGGKVWIKPDGSFEYVPDIHFKGEDSFQYQLVDGDGSKSDWATVTLTVPGPPDPVKPPVVDDAYDVVEATFTASVGNVLANDGLGSGATVAKVIVDGVTYDVPAGGVKIPTSLGGTLLIMQDGSFAYDAPARDHGGRGFDSDGEDIDRFQYIAKDADGNLSDPASVVINITDTVPVAHDDAYQLGSEHDSFRFTANVMDNDEFSQDYVLVAGKDSIQNAVNLVRAGDGAPEVAVNGSYDIYNPTFVTANGGKVWIKPDGSFEYVPDIHFKGEDSFQYQLVDGDGSKSDWATVTLTVPGPDPVRPPVVDDAYDVVEGAFTASVGNVLANDNAGLGATVAKVIVDGVTYDVPAGGVKIPTSLGGTVFIQPNGDFAYDAATRDHSDGIEDIDRFQYIVKDADGNLSNPASVVVNILDTVPVAHDDAYQLGLEHDSFRFTANVMDNDELSADYVRVDGANSVQNVCLVRAGDGGPEITLSDDPLDPHNPTFVTANGGKVWISQDGSFEYVADIYFEGEDTFQYQLVDGDGSTSDWATVTLTVPGPSVSATAASIADEFYGTEGADVFKWSLADLGDGDGSVTNFVKGFNAAEGDQLDLRDLLQDGDGFLFNTDHLDVSFNGSNTVIAVSPASASAPMLNIVIEGVDLTGGYEGQDAINQLLNNGSLVDDNR